MFYYWIPLTILKCNFSSCFQSTLSLIICHMEIYNPILWCSLIWFSSSITLEIQNMLVEDFSLNWFYHVGFKTFYRLIVVCCWIYFVNPHHYKYLKSWLFLSWLIEKINIDGKISNSIWIEKLFWICIQIKKRKCNSWKVFQLFCTNIRTVAKRRQFKYLWSKLVSKLHAKCLCQELKPASFNTAIKNIGEKVTHWITWETLLCSKV